MTNRLWNSSGRPYDRDGDPLVGAAIPRVAQGPSATPAKATAASTKPWTLSRTPDGQPDLQGYWTSLSFTPMERPAKYAGREFLTDEEMAEVFKAGVQHAYEFTFANSAEVPVYDATVYALGAWQNGVTPNRRTSLVVDPPDGRIPSAHARSAEGQSSDEESWGGRGARRRRACRWPGGFGSGCSMPFLWRTANPSCRLQQQQLCASCRAQAT